MTSAGFLWMGGNIIGIVLLFAAGFLRNSVTGSMMNSMWLLCGVGALGMILSFLLLCLNTKYHRLEAESEKFENTVN